MTTSTSRTSRHRHLVRVGAVAALLFLAGAGCSSSDDSAATTTTTEISTCTAMQDLSTSLSTLLSQDTLTGGTEAIQAAFTDVQTSFDQVEASASSDFGDDVDALSQALDQLSSAIGDLGTDEGAAATLSAVGGAANDALTAFDTLSTDVTSQTSGCDLTTPTTAAG